MPPGAIVALVVFPAVLFRNFPYLVRQLVDPLNAYAHPVSHGL